MLTWLVTFWQGVVVQWLRMTCAAGRLGGFHIELLDCSARSSHTLQCANTLQNLDEKLNKDPDADHQSLRTTVSEQRLRHGGRSDLTEAYL